MVLMNNQFRICACYYAVPALEGAKKRIVIPIGRTGSQMQIATVDDFRVVDVEISPFCGREFARGMLRDGFYTLSSVCEVSDAEYAAVREILGGEK